MTIPQLPTDSLYKFMAISGLVLLIFSFTAPYILANDLQLKTLAEMVKWEVDVKSQKIDFKKAKISGKMPDDIEERLKQNELAQIQRDYFLKSLNVQEKELIRVVLYATFSRYFGFALFISGFILWYVKIQKYQDALLKRQANEKP